MTTSQKIGWILFAIIIALLAMATYGVTVIAGVGTTVLFLAMTVGFVGVAWLGVAMWARLERGWHGGNRRSPGEARRNG
jgi:hypothetical protein